jgi:Family of unknown function (DUF6629)
MCFSASADFVVGGFMVAVGIDAVRHVRRPAQRWLAAVPLVLGSHQLVEGFVWRGLEGAVSESTWRAALWVYLVIAFAVVPVLIPVAVGALEPVVHRRRTFIFTAIGAFVGGVLMYAVVRGPVEAVIEGHHIAYAVDLWHGGLLVGLYVIATCGSLLASSHREIRWLGGMNLVVLVLLAWVDQRAFISLWCAWASVTSIMIALWLRVDEREGRTGQDLAPRPSPSPQV